MPRHRRYGLDPDTADRLLDGGRDGPPRLSALLAQASGPGHAGELAGEDAAAAVFRSAQAVPVEPRRRIVTARWARWVSVKTAAIALALAAGGVAVAAGTGVLPSPLRIGAAPPIRTPQPAAVVSASATGRGSGGGSAAGGASPSASLYGLCTAFLAQIGATPEKATQDPTYPELIAAAGDVGNVTSYCHRLLNGPSGTAMAEHGKSDEHPTGPPSPHPTGHDPKGKASASTR